MLGQKDSLQGLQTDVFLHPADGFTAYTLKKRTFIYNQSPLSLPLPSWAWWGITDNITAEIDLLPLLGGFFQKPNLPVPSFNFRFKLKDQNKLNPALAFETMFQYLYNPIDQSNNIYFASWRKGASWFNRVNASWCIKSKFYIHVSAGVTYSHYLRLINKDSQYYKEKIFVDKISPDASLTFDYRFKRISYHATVSYGTTFIGIDNVPRKFQIVYSVRVAPFYKFKYGILRNFRFDWQGFYVAFPDIMASAYIPIFIPYVYWQWTIKNRQKQN